MIYLPAASMIRSEIANALDAAYPKHLMYWKCRVPQVVVHARWVGSNWTWFALAERADLQLISHAAESVRKRYPRARA